jgi:hypothetical protein
MRVVAATMSPQEASDSSSNELSRMPFTKKSIDCLRSIGDATIRGGMPSSKKRPIMIHDFLLGNKPNRSWAP